MAKKAGGRKAPPSGAKKRTSGPSGRTQSKDSRRESGRVRLDVWLSEEEAAVLEKLARDRSRRDVIGALLLAAKS